MPPGATQKAANERPERVRKPRKPCGLAAALSDSQSDSLFTWLAKEKISYHAAAARLFKEFGVQTSHSAVYNFWHRVSSRRLIGRNQPKPGPVLFELVIQIRQPGAAADTFTFPIPAPQPVAPAINPPSPAQPE